MIEKTIVIIEDSELTNDFLKYFFNNYVGDDNQELKINKKFFNSYEDIILNFNKYFKINEDMIYLNNENNEKIDLFILDFFIRNSDYTLQEFLEFLKINLYIYN